MRDPSDEVSTIAQLYPLILASASPRRLLLLLKIGITPAQIIEPHVEETPFPTEHPMALAERLATKKVNAVSVPGGRMLVLAADTVVEIDGESVGTAIFPEQARATLCRLSARTHHVYTSVAIKCNDGEIVKRTVSTAVTFREILKKEVDDYIASNEWRGKAGCYGIQGYASYFCAGMTGSFSNVIGLPVGETLSLLRHFQTTRRRSDGRD